MTVCDICKQEITSCGKRLSLPYEKSGGLLNHKDFDVCFSCSIQLERAIEMAKLDFVNRRNDNDKSTMESNI